MKKGQPYLPGVQPQPVSSLNPLSTRSSVENDLFVRGRYGFDSDTLPFVETISPQLRKSIIEDGQIQTPSTNGRQHSHSLPTNLQAGDDLKEHIDSLWEASISPRTAAVYKTAINLFLHFVTLCGLCVPEDKLPCIDEDILIRFVSYCDKALLLKCATIKLYLAGIRFSYLRSGATNPLANCERLQYILKGVKKQQQGTATTRLPITFDILRKICDLLRNGVFSPVTDLLLQCMCQTAFFGFMRCGEFTRDSRGFCSEGLKMNDVIFSKDHSYFSIFLSSSKTDPFRLGVYIHFFRNPVLCPVDTMTRYYKLRLSQGAVSTSPLFTDNASQAVTKIHWFH
ncbi:uncharacterized protein [Argopecten irradians]|uniref:uncharacterized protein n=1 Tax=Argopecten irradians TaxID=31199 RepID=UPI003716507A